MGRMKSDTCILLSQAKEQKKERIFFVVLSLYGFQRIKKQRKIIYMFSFSLSHFIFSLFYNTCFIISVSSNFIGT